MAQNMRSFGQQERHSETRRNKDERRKLISALIRQEAALKAALKDVRAILKELGPYATTS